MRNIAALLRLLFSCLCCVVGVLSAYDDVPTKKADHPKMNPKPKLPEVTHYVYLDIEYIWGDNPHFSSLSMKKDWNVYQELHREKAKSLNIKYDDEKTRFTDRIVLGLFGTVAPKTVENFLGLIRCDKGKGKYTGEELCLKGTSFHRIVRHLLLQGGDFSHADGTGGESIYGGYFEDEAFDVDFKKPYLLAMANSGEPDTNGSQFFITVSKMRWLDGKNVVFGRVMDRFDAVDYVECFGTFSGEPQRKVKIVDCGELDESEVNLEISSVY